MNYAIHLSITILKKKCKIQSNNASLATNEGHFLIKEKELSVILAFLIEIMPQRNRITPFDERKLFFVEERPLKKCGRNEAIRKSNSFATANEISVSGEHPQWMLKTIHERLMGNWTSTWSPSGPPQAT